MKIAQIVSLGERVPPKKYGGTERVVYALTEELVKRGHEITLFATGDSTTSAKLVSVYPKGLRDSKIIDPYGSNFWNIFNIGKAYSIQDQFDIIHDHSDLISLPAANIASTPVLLTMHGAFNRDNFKYFSTLRKPYIATISKAQSRFAPGLNYAGTVYNGLAMENYPFSQEHDGYLLYVGRISMEKGVHHAIAAAQLLDLPLIIAAKLDPAEMSYFKIYVEPYLGDNIRWIGEVDEIKRNELMSRAMCFLHPVTWPEPFGLTLIEAMACGCPVVAFSRGSIPEVVSHEKTGFVVSEIDEMLDSILNIDKIDRGACRRYALENFNAKRMADGYEKIYKSILRRSTKVRMHKK